MDCLVRVIDTLLYLFGVNCTQRVRHPALIVAQPFRRGDPQVSEWFKVFYELRKLVILQIISVLILQGK